MDRRTERGRAREVGAAKPRPAWPLLLALAVLFEVGAGPAQAHNRPPLCTSLAENRGDLVIGTSFGLLMSHDQGRSFRWVCEEAVGSAYGIDIHLVPVGGRLVAGTTFGVFASDDRGCSWSEGSGTDGRAVSDLAHDGNDRLYAVTQSSAVSNAVLVSEDLGQSFTALLEREPPLVFNSVRVAPTRPGRIYAGAYANQVGLVLVSDDAGETWEEHSTQIELPTAVLGVDPDNHQVLYLRVLGFTASLRKDQLLRSPDGGQSFEVLLELDDSITGFQALRDGSLWVSTANAGVHHSSDRGASFEPLPGAPHATCLGAYQDQVYLCGQDVVDGASLFEVLPDRSGIEPVFAFADLCGPIDCPQDSPASTTCLPFYPAVSAQIGVDPQACQPGLADGGSDSGAAPDGAGGDRGSPTEPDPPGGGCAQTAGAAPLAAPGLALALLLWTSALALRRSARAAAAPPARRRRSRSAPR